MLTYLFQVGGTGGINLMALLWPNLLSTGIYLFLLRKLVAASCCELSRFSEFRVWDGFPPTTFRDELGSTFLRHRALLSLRIMTVRRNLQFRLRRPPSQW